MKTYFSVTGLTLKPELEKYANAKLARLSRRVPRKYRAQSDFQVELKRAVKQGIKHNTCNITLAFDGAELKAQETTQHMYAALDICAVQIESQLKRHMRERRLGLLRRHFGTR